MEVWSAHANCKTRIAAADIGDKVYVIGGGPEPDIFFANVVETLNVGSNGVNAGNAGTAGTAGTPR